MKFRYLTADVFTDVPFGGNQLAVFPDASEIPERHLLDITREFNYAETVFVFPPQSPQHTRRLRIFTPGGEIPFAGHPTVGAAHVLAETGAIPLTGLETQIVFEEGVGPVRVMIRAAQGRPTFAQLSVAKLPEVGPPPPQLEIIAELLSLEPMDLAGGTMAPEALSCGMPFLIVPLRDRGAVRRARIRIERWEEALAGYWAPMVMVVAADPERPGSDLRARMFAPGLGIAEDPATGSACAALGGYLAARDERRAGKLRWIVEQGFEIGRPSILEVEADKRDHAITGIRVGGATVLVSEGTLRVPTGA